MVHLRGPIAATIRDECGVFPFDAEVARSRELADFAEAPRCGGKKLRLFLEQVGNVETAGELAASKIGVGSQPDFDSLRRRLAGVHPTGVDDRNGAVGTTQEFILEYIVVR